jgi:hypothetical protein
MKFICEMDQHAVAGFPTGVVGVAMDGRVQLRLGDAGIIGENAMNAAQKTRPKKMRPRSDAATDGDRWARDL